MRQVRCYLNVAVCYFANSIKLPNFLSFVQSDREGIEVQTSLRNRYFQGEKRISKFQLTILLIGIKNSQRTPHNKSTLEKMQNVSAVILGTADSEIQKRVCLSNIFFQKFYLILHTNLLVEVGLQRLEEVTGNKISL